MGKESSPNTDGEVAKRLFTPSPEKAATVRDPLHKHGWNWGSKGRNSFRIGVWGALIFMVLCVSVVLVTVKLNSSWTDVTLEDVHRFFSNELLRSHPPDGSRLTFSTGYFYFNGQPLFGFLGAFPLALVLGAACGAFTCLFMFYDSDEPGSFPPTPVSPPRQHSGHRAIHTEWHLGYLFVPINILVSFSLAMFYFRWNMGLPML